MLMADLPCGLVCLVLVTDAVESSRFCANPDLMFEWDDVVQVQQGLGEGAGEGAGEGRERQGSGGEGRRR